MAVRETVTFRGAVDRALARNPDARRAAEEIHRAHALMEEARAASLPTLGGNGTYTRLDHDRVSNGAVVAAKGALNLNLGLNVPIVNARGWTEWQQAGDQIDVQTENAADTRRLVAVAAARAYLSRRR